MTGRRQAGQAAVDLVGALPLVAGVVMAVAQLLAAGAARELAGHAAEAGATALVRDEDPVAAARRAVPGWSHARVSVEVADRRVRVRLRPAGVVPGVSGLLTATAEANAGAR